LVLELCHRSVRWDCWLPKAVVETTADALRTAYWRGDRPLRYFTPNQPKVGPGGYRHSPGEWPNWQRSSTMSDPTHLRSVPVVPLPGLRRGTRPGVPHPQWPRGGVSACTKDCARALCCECGNLRTTSARYRRNDDNLTFEDNRHPQGWRCTRTLKCSICRAPTRHAVLRDDDSDRPEFRDIAETRQHLRPGEGLGVWDVWNGLSHDDGGCKR
jgi:hypothetical protein